MTQGDSQQQIFTSFLFVVLLWFFHVTWLSKLTWLLKLFVLNFNVSTYTLKNKLFSMVWLWFSWSSAYKWLHLNNTKMLPYRFLSWCNRTFKLHAVINNIKAFDMHLSTVYFLTRYIRSTEPGASPTIVYRIDMVSSVSHGRGLSFVFTSRKLTVVSSGEDGLATDKVWVPNSKKPILYPA